MTHATREYNVRQGGRIIPGSKLGRTTSFLFLVVLGTIWGCGSEEHSEDNRETLFVIVPSDRSGISFRNDLTENDSVNYFNYMYIYMGGGVAIGDLNNDGLSDIYLTGNMVSNKLYINKGNLKFQDVTEQARVGGDDRWVTGVTLGDANQDGWLDIYVSVSGKWKTTRNLLYINNAEKGEVPTFTESAEEYKVADSGNSTQAVFFDYDLDGDQDLYVINYPLVSSRTSISQYLSFRNNAPYDKSDRLYKNEGNGKFTDVTQRAGLDRYALSLGVSVGDYNQDGWPDIYVSNDFSTPDYFLINQKDGTFKDLNLQLTNHTSYFGMGSDVADFNNDGLLDLYQVDMMPKSHRRAKENMDSMDPERFNNMVSHGMHHQYSTNTLQLNMGLDSLGLPHFGDIAKFAGVSSTDWSWASLFADFDNDGLKDIYVTNGVRRDINNSDYFRGDHMKDLQHGDPLEMTRKIPSEKIHNYAFRNQGNLSFENISEKWGIDYNGFSNGVAYGDLDNDGDLDLVINNLDDTSVLYENRADKLKNNHFLELKLQGPMNNPIGLGSKIWVKYGDQTQFQETTLSRGFQSSVDPVVHFGTGKNASIEELRILWQDGNEEILHDVAADQMLTLHHRSASPPKNRGVVQVKSPMYRDISAAVGLDHRHIENNFNDFKYQVLLPHKISQYGPALCVGDMDNDGLDDFYIGGSSQASGMLYHQQKDGRFEKISETIWEDDKGMEDVGATLFDADGDGLQDLYVVSGGNEFNPGNRYYQDRFYHNKGGGKFEKRENALPRITESGSVVVPADFDGDGDLDLFVGGRIAPRQYPNPPKSYLLRNVSTGTEIKFEDATESLAPDLLDLGMVTQAEWADLDDDGYVDLFLTGEWMGITYLKNTGDGFVNQSREAGLDDTSGWWFGMAAHDFDGDGDRDFVLGNLGKNYKYQAHRDSPFSLYAYDYDSNNKQDIVLSYVDKGGMELPVRGRECSSQQIPAISIKFKDYHSFATASLKEIYSTEHLAKATHYQVKDFGHAYVENLGHGKFRVRTLKDAIAQLAPINAMLAHDLDRDGKADVLYGGNLYGSEVETPRGDTSYGGVMLGNGKGNFKALPLSETGLFLRGEIKAIKKIRLAGGLTGVLVAKNNDYLQLLRRD